MAAPAPGQPAAQQEPSCYNCGTKGHWVVACPEPTRDVPAGLQRWQSQQQDQLQVPERNNSGPDKKRPVVTRYPSLPNHGPTIQRYGPPPTTTYLPGVPPPPLPPPPPSQPYPSTYQPPPPYGPSYPQPQPQPPPAQSYYEPYSSGPPPPPFGPHPPPTYGQPLQPPPPYQQPGYYAPPPPAPYPPSSYQPPPYPPLSGYPQTYPPPNNQPPPYPPPGHAAIHIPPPPSVPHYPPSAGRQRPSRGDGSSQPRHPHRQRGKHPKHQGPRRSSLNAQDHKPRPTRDRTPSAILGRQHQSPSEPQRDHGTPREERTEDSPSTEKPPKAHSEGATDNDGDEDLQDELDLIFAENSTKPGDPVGIPLPHEYTDAPTIPPAYNATCIKSRFLREDNEKEFSRSIWESTEWDFEHDPVFKVYPGMIYRKFPGHSHAYATYEPPIRHSASAPIKLPPRFRIDRETLEARKGRQRWQVDQGRSSDRSREHPGRGISTERHNREGNSYRGTPNSSGKRGRGDFRGSDENRPKRARTSPNQPATPSWSRQSSLQQSTPKAVSIGGHGEWSPQAEESGASDNDATGKLSRPRGGRYDRHSSSHDDPDRRPASSNIRHDSGYHSGQSQDKFRSSHRDSELSRQPAERSYSRRTSRSRSPPSGHSHRSPPEARRARRRSSSPLTALEAELLGLSHPSESRAKTSTPKKPARRQVKVASAFSRRW